MILYTYLFTFHACMVRCMILGTAFTVNFVKLFIQYSYYYENYEIYTVIVELKVIFIRIDFIHLQILIFSYLLLGPV